MHGKGFAAKQAASFFKFEKKKSKKGVTEPLSSTRANEDNCLTHRRNWRKHYNNLEKPWG